MYGFGVLEVSGLTSECKESYVARCTERIVSSKYIGKAYELKNCQKLVGELVFCRNTLSRYTCREGSGLDICGNFLR